MIVAIVVGVIAMGLAIMGMKCTNCGGDDKRKKAWIAVTGGVVFQIGGKQAGRKLALDDQPGCQKVLSCSLKGAPYIQPFILTPVTEFLI